MRLIPVNYSPCQVDIFNKLKKKIITTTKDPCELDQVKLKVIAVLPGKSLFVDRNRLLLPLNRLLLQAKLVELTRGYAW